MVLCRSFSVMVLSRWTPTLWCLYAEQALYSSPPDTHRLPIKVVTSCGTPRRGTARRDLSSGAEKIIRSVPIIYDGPSLVVSPERFRNSHGPEGSSYDLATGQAEGSRWARFARSLTSFTTCTPTSLFQLSHHVFGSESCFYNEDSGDLDHYSM